MADNAGARSLILVLERDFARPSRVVTRAVLEHGDLAPTSLMEYRLMLRQALADLPGDARAVPVGIMPQRRKDDRGG